MASTRGVRLPHVPCELRLFCAWRGWRCWSWRCWSRQGLSLEVGSMSRLGFGCLDDVGSRCRSDWFTTVPGLATLHGRRMLPHCCACHAHTGGCLSRVFAAVVAELECLSVRGGPCHFGSHESLSQPRRLRTVTGMQLPTCHCLRQDLLRPVLLDYPDRRR